MKKQIQKGFTLIELMIVVAIIGILASIALPAYQDYIARAQATEGIMLIEGIKPTVAETYADLGNKTGINSGSYGIPPAANTSGKYVNDVAVADAVITATFKSTGVSKELQGKKLNLTPVDLNGTLHWSCSTDAPKKLVPSSCR